MAGSPTDALKHGQPVLAQGITTVFVNPDGGGPIDLDAQRATYEKQRIGPNVGLIVPHGSIRREVMAMTDRDPNADEAREDGGARVARACAPARSDCRAASTTPPARYSKTAEVVAMAKATAPFGGVYSSHIRDEADYTIGVIAAVQEVITIAEQGGLIGVVCHVKALGPASHGTVDGHRRTHRGGARARRAGVCRSVSLRGQRHRHHRRADAALGASGRARRAAEAHSRRAARKRSRARCRINIARRGGAETLVISRFSADPSIEGQRLSRARGQAGVAPRSTRSTCCEKGDASLVSFNMSERDIELIMRQPWNMTCTDGDLVPMGQGKPHPRAYGAFPRKLQRYVHERGVIDLAFAIRIDDVAAGTRVRPEGSRTDSRRRVRRHVDLRSREGERRRDVSGTASARRGLDDIVVNGEVVRRNGDVRAGAARPRLAPERR